MTCAELHLIRRVPSTWHIATLQMKAGITLITNLGQVCLFSNLITIPVQCCEFWVGNTALFCWVQGRNLLGDDQNFKRGREAKKWENQISRGRSLFFFFINQNFCHILFLFLQVLQQKRDP